MPRPSPAATSAIQVCALGFYTSFVACCLYTSASWHRREPRGTHVPATFLFKQSRDAVWVCVHPISGPGSTLQMSVLSFLAPAEVGQQLQPMPMQAVAAH